MKNLPQHLLLIKQSAQDSGLELVTDEQALAKYHTDFGGVIKSTAAAVAKPQTLAQLIKFVEFANNHHIPLTIRTFGLSQSGQALAHQGGVIVDLSNFTEVGIFDPQTPSITADCAANWREVLNRVLPQGYIPYVLPFNLELSVGGVLSAGGFGSASMRHGVIAAHVNSLEVITANGEQYHCDPQQQTELFNATRAGVGRFGIINRANIALRKVQPQVRSFYLLYDDYQQWLRDQLIVQQQLDCDYLEAFCTPCIQGMRNSPQGRVVFPHWFYGMHLSYEYTTEPPSITRLAALKYYKHVYTEDNPIADYVNRHQSRFEMMKHNGNWQQLHPWYECFVPAKLITELLPSILQKIPLFLGGIYHLFTLATNQLPPYLMVPTSDAVMAFCVLTPGIGPEQLPLALQLIDELDEILLPQGGKRYLSGWLNSSKIADYWQRHYQQNYAELVKLKRTYDPHNTFGSCLLPLV